MCHNRSDEPTDAELHHAQCAFAGIANPACKRATGPGRTDLLGHTDGQHGDDNGNQQSNNRAGALACA